jgi:hypothetical protein
VRPSCSARETCWLSRESRSEGRIMTFVFFLPTVRTGRERSRSTFALCGSRRTEVSCRGLSLPFFCMLIFLFPLDRPYFRAYRDALLRRARGNQVQVEGVECVSLPPLFTLSSLSPLTFVPSSSHCRPRRTRPVCPHPCHGRRLLLGTDGPGRKGNGRDQEALGCELVADSSG